MNWPFGTVLRDPQTGGLLMVVAEYDGASGRLFHGVIVQQPDEVDPAEDEEWTGVGTGIDNLDLATPEGWWAGYEWELVDDEDR